MTARSRCRNMKIYNDDGTLIGGVRQNGSITTQNFFDMVSILVGQSRVMIARAADPNKIPLVPSSQQLPVDDYVITSTTRQVIDLESNCEIDT
ncbi:hypothetical protein N7466_001256 [Penicillium verhagenii]|uniref:uncharacterized protein n=1 Tax=Penicillium verhagenii TaxID=1562060 RepID=UPI002545B698|nr:uncharacterized protein N7466_001256 [Penicillium verhagenii]KAJ5948241.1 hypothetical protein N7466_001256 [Penicillium verhagenii]